MVMAGVFTVPEIRNQGQASLYGLEIKWKDRNGPKVMGGDVYGLVNRYKDRGGPKAMVSDGFDLGKPERMTELWCQGMGGDEC